jgi:hypothetical protein
MEVFFIVKKNNSVLEMSRAELEEEELTLTIIKTGNSLDIEVKYPTDYFTLDWRDRINIDFKIYAPKATACDLRTSDGNVSLLGLSAPQRLRTSDGNIMITDVTGEVAGVTSDGNIKAEKINGATTVKTSDGNIILQDVVGNVETVTSDGDIRVGNVTGNVRSTTSDGNIDLIKVKGENTASTSDGDIYFQDLSGSLVASVSDGSIKGNIIELTSQLRAKTSDGSIEITIPNNLGLNLYIKGDNLDVPLSNFSGRSEEDLIDGKTNGGGIDVNLTSSDGRISLIYR